MTNKQIIIITSVIIGLILLLYLFYFITIRPVLKGEYMPTKKECSKVYQCVCLYDTCNCSYKKWGIENKMVCEKDGLKQTQMK